MTGRRADRVSERCVLVLVPRPSRDFDGLALVAYHLRATHNVSTVFCAPDEANEACARLAPDAVVLDILGWESRIRLVRLAKKLRAHVAVVPVAGMFGSDCDRVAGLDPAARELVDRFLVWGESARRFLCDEHAISSDRVRPVGVPRFDFYHPDHLSLMGGRAEFLARQGFRRTNAPVVVWATGTPEADGLTDAEIAERAASTGYAENVLRREIAEQQTMFSEHAELILRIARHHRDWNIIVKVHPRESPRRYRSLLRREPNVRLAANEAARMFLHHCDALLQCGSTTSTEAWLLGKSVIQLPSTATWNDELPAIYHQGNQSVADADECERVLECCIAGAPVPEDQQRARNIFVHEFLCGNDGRASQRCAAEIAALVLPPARTDADRAETLRLSSEATHRLPAETLRWSSKIKDMLGVSRDSSLRPWRWARRRNTPAVLPASRLNAMYREFADVIDRSRPSQERAS